MKALIGLMLLAMLATLGFYLREASNRQAEIANTLVILNEAKQTARANWTNQPDPTDLSSLEHALRWGATLQTQFHARHTLDTNRLIQITLPKVPQNLCADILQALVTARIDGLWLRLDVNNEALNTPIDLATRKRLCTNEPALSVYFRF